MATVTPSMPFPHPVLTPIIGEPTVLSIRKLRREIYTNAAACHSTRGGGVNGHLGLVLTELAYLVRAGQPYIVPVHPGAVPVHGVGATAAQITETNRQFAQSQADHRLHTTVLQELRKQIIAAVEPKYFAILNNGDFGLTDVSALALIQHLEATYGTITPEDIEANRNLLTAIINIDDPLEDLWLRISTCQDYAENAGEDITDGTAIRLTLSVFDQTGVYDHACLSWREKDAADQTFPTFKTHFIAANTERRRRLTAQGGGFHGANAARAQGIGNQQGGRANAGAGPRDPLVVIDGDIFMSYCWSHGLITNCSHNSGNCEHRNNGHIANATIRNMQGGNATIYVPRRDAPNGE